MEAAAQQKMQSPPASFSAAQRAFTTSSRASTTNALSQMMELGREELLMKEADVAKSIVVKSNNRDRVGLTSTELSHLHQQLACITTTCTLIIGFAMASLSADLLRELGDDTGQFCVYKSLPSTLLSGLFILLTTTCICACFTIIACTQIIIFQSQRAIFSRRMVHKVERAITRRGAGNGGRQINLTSRVVRMTQLLMYGDRSGNWDGLHAGWEGREAGKGRGGRNAFGFTIYVGLAIALTCFFLSTVILIWVFLSPLSRWRELPRAPTNGGVVRDGLGMNVTNPSLVTTHEGVWKTRCLDPYNDADEARKEIIGSVLSSVSTLVFLVNVAIGWRSALGTIRRYSLEALLALPDDDHDEIDAGRARWSQGGAQNSALREGFEEDKIHEAHEATRVRMSVSMEHHHHHSEREQGHHVEV
jgi:hypothetical protein